MTNNHGRGLLHDQATLGLLNAVVPEAGHKHRKLEVKLKISEHAVARDVLREQFLRNQG